MAICLIVVQGVSDHSVAHAAVPELLILPWKSSLWTSSMPQGTTTQAHVMQMVAARMSSTPSTGPEAAGLMAMQKRHMPMVTEAAGTDETKTVNRGMVTEVATKEATTAPG